MQWNKMLQQLSWLSASGVLNIWCASQKTDPKVFVVVIPKEGWARTAGPILLLVWHWLFRIWVFWLHRSHSLKVGVIPKEGWAWPRAPILVAAPILLLVWQRQRPKGLFSRDACHFFSQTSCNILYWSLHTTSIQLSFYLGAFNFSISFIQIMMRWKERYFL